MPEKIFSISKAAKYLGVFVLTVRNWEKKGFIKSFRTPGGHRRFRKSELDKIVGIERVEDILKESIKRLEAISFKNGRQEKLHKIIKELKSISEEREN